MMNTHTNMFINRQFITRFPQWTSFCILLISGILSLILLPVIELTGTSFKYLYQFLLMGLIAGSLSYLIDLPIWWQRINTFFGLLLFIFYSIELPSWVYLIGLVFLISFYWNTIVTRVPYYPSNIEVWQSLEQLIPQNTPIKILEIGSGFGGFTRHISKRMYQAECVGLETAPVPWFISKFLAFIESAPCSLQRKNYMSVNFAEYDFIYAFLSPAAMQILYDKSKNELRSSSKIVSYMFTWPSDATDHVNAVQLSSGNYLYVYSKS